MIGNIFNRLGGQRAVKAFMDRKFSTLEDQSMREQTDEGSSVRQGEVVGANDFRVKS